MARQQRVKMQDPFTHLPRLSNQANGDGQSAGLNKTLSRMWNSLGLLASFVDV